MRSVAHEGGCPSAVARTHAATWTDPAHAHAQEEARREGPRGCDPIHVARPETGSGSAVAGLGAGRGRGVTADGAGASFWGGGMSWNLNTLKLNLYLIKQKTYYIY